MNGEGSPIALDTMAAATVDATTVSAKTVADGCIIKVMVHGDNQRRHEAIFTFVGVLKAYDLPPVKKSEISASRVKYARQHVKIVGFNKAAFKRALDIIQDVAYLLVTAVLAGQMEPRVPEIKSDKLGLSLVANCRYFTLGRDIKPEAWMEFDKYVDPAKSLAAFVGPQVAHCINNYVGYLEPKGNKCVSLVVSSGKRFDWKPDLFLKIRQDSGKETSFRLGLL
ncbi:hypothetical protein B0H19DRAFT_1085979 [Mycena capillaripes]|nr:hypothetical protein B0H19DRAFT_1085979 [Mycena capillaripes]